jgi:hypothetical protein
VTNVQFYGLYNETESPAAGTLTAFTLTVGDQIALTFIGKSTTNSAQFVTVQGSGFSTNAPASVATVSGNVLVIHGATSQSYTVSGSYGGKSYSATFTSVASSAKVAGQINDTNGNPVYAVPIQFYSGTTLVGAAVTGPGGSFIGEVPATANGFVANFASVGGYYNEYVYSRLNYAPTVNTCRSPLPALTTGSVTSLLTPIVVYVYDTNNPPPAPTGCGS